MKINYQYKKILSDTLTPVSVYLNVRDKFPNSIMLESSDYHGEEHNISYICIHPMAGFQMKDENLTFKNPDGTSQKFAADSIDVADKINEFIKSVDVAPIDLPFIYGGLFGYMAYDAIQYFEDLKFKDKTPDIPILDYAMYQFVIAFNHFNNELYIIKAIVDGKTEGQSIEEIITILKKPIGDTYKFTKEGERTSNCDNDHYLEMVKKGIHHCQRGDVFQIVFSRAFQQKFKGDEFNVYRALRSINPSPYLFYFDYGNFKLFGSSPEAQLIIKDGKVTIHPIAGTFRRSGDDKRDAELAIELTKDPKETAEHVMLVDLARNDLSRNGKDVKVEVYKEIQYFSHVIHLVSKVTSTFHEGSNKVKIIGDTFPAGTLTGAPKYRAMQLIDDNEKTARGFYGGCIGHLGFNGDFNHAIMIRTFKSSKNQLKYQAGAGIVVDSKPENELQEVENKLMALNKAILLAEEL
ncbi:MAG: anthranilate synthase component I family protein [Chitinophagales bacterium]